MDEKPEIDDRDYHVMREEGITLDDSYFSRYPSDETKIRIFTPALFGGIMLLTVVTIFGFMMLSMFPS